MDASRKNIVPGYIRYFFIASNIVLTTLILTTASFIISPLIAALIIAILLNPLYSKLIKLRIPRILSAGIAVLVFLLVIGILLSYITTQLGFITSDPAISTTQFTKILANTQRFIAHLFDYSLADQAKLIEDSFNNFVKNLVTYAPNAFTGTAGYISMLILFFLSLFFFLYYRSFFMSFIYKIFGRGNTDHVKETIDKIEEAVKNYIVGLFIVISIVAIFNSIGLLALGIHHAVFFGILGALLTIIPYIGILIGSLLPALFALVTTDSLWDPLFVILIFSFVQFLEGNFISPNIIGSKENINPYIAILGLFTGGMLLGAVGVVLAIPLLGIIKIICDDVEPLKPIGYLMGNPKKDPNSVKTWLSKFIENFKDKKK